MSRRVAAATALLGVVFPKEMRAGTMSELEVIVTMADPVFGIFNTADFAAQATLDHAAGTGSFRY